MGHYKGVWTKHGPYVLQGNYGRGWEDLCQDESLPSLEKTQSVYQREEGGVYRIIRKADANSMGE